MSSCLPKAFVPSTSPAPPKKQIGQEEKAILANKGENFGPQYPMSVRAEANESVRQSELQDDQTSTGWTELRVSPAERMKAVAKRLGYGSMVGHNA